MMRINTHGDIEFNHKSVTLDELPRAEHAQAAIFLHWQRRHTTPMFRLDYFVGQLTWHLEFLTPDITIPYGIAARLKANVEVLSSPNENHHVLVILPTTSGSLVTDRDRFYNEASRWLAVHGLAVS